MPTSNTLLGPIAIHIELMGIFFIAKIGVNNIFGILNMLRLKS